MKKVIVIGTGLESSILAGALSRSEEHEVVQIDCSQSYGGMEFPMLSLQELIAMQDAVTTIYTAKNDALSKEGKEEGSPSSLLGLKQEFLDRLLGKFSKRFLFELNPRVLYSSGPLVDLLVQSGAGEGILEFQLVKEVLHAKTTAVLDQASSSMHSATSFQLHPAERVPSSKEDVFVDEKISLRDKRVLMKFFTSCINESTGDGDPDVDSSFLDFVAKSKIPENLQEVVVKCLTLTLENVDLAQMSKVTGVQMINMYLKSIGKFGNGALLTAMYGTGSELCQAFSRYAAVHGGVSALDCQVLGIVPNSSPGSESCDGFIVQTSVETFHADTLCVAADQLPHLAHLSLTGPISFAKHCKLDREEEKTFHLFLVSETQSLLSSSNHVLQLFTAGYEMDGVYCMQYNSDCGMCPRDVCEYFFLIVYSLLIVVVSRLLLSADVLHLWTSGKDEALLLQIEKELLREREQTSSLSIRVSTPSRSSSPIPTSISADIAKNNNLYVLSDSGNCKKQQLIIESSVSQAREVFNAITANRCDFYPKKTVTDDD